MQNQQNFQKSSGVKISPWPCYSCWIVDKVTMLIVETECWDKIQSWYRLILLRLEFWNAYQHFLEVLKLWIMLLWLLKLSTLSFRKMIARCQCCHQDLDQVWALFIGTLANQEFIQKECQCCRIFLDQVRHASLIDVLRDQACAWSIRFDQFS